MQPIHDVNKESWFDHVEKNYFIQLLLKQWNGLQVWNTAYWFMQYYMLDAQEQQTQEFFPFYKDFLSPSGISELNCG